MKTLWRIISRTLFWEYERGTWPYDVMVGGIVLFVFLSPPSWFKDRPQTAAEMAAEEQAAPGSEAAVHAQVELVREDAAAHTRTYRVDPALLAAASATERERKAHDVLRKHVPELQGRTFQITRVETLRSSSGAPVSFEVSIK